MLLTVALRPFLVSYMPCLLGKVALGNPVKLVVGRIPGGMLLSRVRPHSSMSICNIINTSYMLVDASVEMCDVGYPSVSVPWPFSLLSPISGKSNLREEKSGLAQSLREYNPFWWGRYGDRWVQVGRNVKLLAPISVDQESEKEECQSLIGSPPTLFFQSGTTAQELPTLSWSSLEKPPLPLHCPHQVCFLTSLGIY